MVPWLQPATDNASSRVSVNRWLVSTLPPTTAGQFSGSAVYSGLRSPRGMRISIGSSRPSLSGSSTSTSSRMTYIVTEWTMAGVALRLPGWTSALPAKSRTALLPSTRKGRNQRRAVVEQLPALVAPVGPSSRAPSRPATPPAAARRPCAPARARNPPSPQGRSGPRSP